MSLIPYYPPEGLEVVLRHQNAIVVRDNSSQRLEIRDLRKLTECPTCHQPLRSSSPDRAARHDSPNFVDPNYFLMLRNRSREGVNRGTEPPSSPIRRLTQPALADVVASGIDDEPDADYVSSAPVVGVGEGSRIRREAFSPKYFSTFFVEEGILGRGGKGVVMLVRHEIDGCHLGHFACKRVPVGNDHAWLEKVLVEVELLASLSHRNLVSYRHVWLEDVKMNRFGPSVACAYILQQYCNGGDLLHYIIGDQPKEATKEDLKAKIRRRSRGQSDAPDGPVAAMRRLTFEEIYSLFRDITSGLAYLHAANYIHRDLKPSNCLLHRDGSSVTCLISDFGEVQPEKQARKSTGSTGTISFCAPEVLKRNASGRFDNFTTKSDIFSLGMILYFLCFGRLPYRSANMVHEELEDTDQLRAEIVDWGGFGTERRQRPDLPAKLYHLLNRLLALDPANRPSAAEVIGAMNNESSVEALGRGKRSGSPSLGLQTHRVHNIDSPLPSSTPVQDSVRSPRLPPPSPEVFTPNEDDPLKSERGPRQTSPRRRTPTLASEAFSEAFTEAFSRGRLESSPRHEHSDLTPTQRMRLIPPLLMPPPTNFADEVRNRARLGWFRTQRLLDDHSEGVSLIVRLGLFLVKMATITQPCWPYTARLDVGLFLVALAGVDLSLPALYLYGAGRPGTGDHTAGSGVVARRTRGSPKTRMWAISAFLMVLHCAVLGAAMRWGGTLCTENHDTWDRW